jgi:hypothetical protein
VHRDDWSHDKLCILTGVSLPLQIQEEPWKMMCTKRLTAHLLPCLLTTLHWGDKWVASCYHTQYLLFPSHILHHSSDSLLCSNWPCPIFEALLKLMILDSGNSLQTYERLLHRKPAVSHLIQAQNLGCCHFLQWVNKWFLVMKIMILVMKPH